MRVGDAEAEDHAEDRREDERRELADGVAVVGCALTALTAHDDHRSVVGEYLRDGCLEEVEIEVVGVEIDDRFAPLSSSPDRSAWP